MQPVPAYGRRQRASRRNEPERISGYTRLRRSGVGHAVLMSAIPKNAWGWVKALLHSVYDQPDADAVHAQFDMPAGSARRVQW